MVVNIILVINMTEKRYVNIAEDDSEIYQDNQTGEVLATYITLDELLFDIINEAIEKGD